ncbi:MAG: hypothetical protein PUC41_00180 [Oscillospiraceae bacterium]|nr:hypothetical protein [Oscillospiraceae bacterium]
MPQPSSAKRRIKPARILAVAAFALIFVLLVLLICFLCGLFAREDESSSSLQDMPVALQSSSSATTTTTTSAATLYPPIAGTTTKTVAITDDALIFGRNAALIDVESHEIIAGKNAEEVIYPASMTKIMTMLTVLKLLGNEENALYQAYRMDGDLVAELRAQTLLCAGFADGEPCRVIDMLYAMMLPSGADAAVGLANFTAGSEEALVAEMNRYATEMGLQQTRFVNCTGLHHEDHYSTPAEIACILEYALQNPLCREIMSTAEYTTAATTAHPEGLVLKSSVFSRLPENMPGGITFGGGKTGFTNAAGQCLASWAVDNKTGKTYISVIAGCDGQKPLDAVCDTMTMYEHFRDGDPSGAARFVHSEEIKENREAA